MGLLQSTVPISMLHTYRKVASSKTSCLEGHAGSFGLFMKGIFDPYVQLLTISIFPNIQALELVTTR